jgi:hypothetical protein
VGARSLMALLTTFLVTVGVLGGVGYAVTQIALSPRRDVFRAGFFEFDLAQGWWCEPDDSEYVCTPPGNPPHAAIAVIAMKERNDKDTLGAYEEHLRQPQRAGSDEGKPGQLSEIRFVNRRTIGTHE